jgi:hypothetical protein
MLSLYCSRVLMRASMLESERLGAMVANDDSELVVYSGVGVDRRMSEVDVR